MALARQAGADRVELYTEEFARHHGTADGAATLARYVAAGQAAHAVGLGLNAGHDLNRDNLAAFDATAHSVCCYRLWHLLPVVDSICPTRKRELGF